MGHYTYLNISEEAQKGSSLMFETIKYLAEAFVFVYLGISLVKINYNDVEVVFTGCLFLVIVFARCFTIFSLPFFTVKYKLSHK
jgi:NhaP-type Na+/H+ or K+/H+ antiporter